MRSLHPPSARTAHTVGLPTLPDDMLREIAKHVDREDLTCLSWTCSALRSVIVGFFVREKLKLSMGWLNRLENLQYAHAHGFDIKESAKEHTRAAAAAGDIERLRWLLVTQKLPMYPADTSNIAAKMGHLRVLRWLRATYKRPWDGRTAGMAAFGGQIRVLAWLRKQPGVNLKTVCTGAARGGQLATLQYARCHGMPWSWRTTFLGILRGNNPALVAWALENGAPEVDQCSLDHTSAAGDTYDKWPESMPR